MLLLLVFVFIIDFRFLPGVTLPGPAYFAFILIAAYFLSPQETAAVGVFATVLKLVADKSGGAQDWLTASYFLALALVTLAGTALAQKMRREAALSAERDRLRAEAEQRAAELDAVNKELEAFSYSVSHDLRAPVRHIEGFCSILLEDYSDRLDDEGKLYLQTLVSSTQKMSGLIDGLLALSRVTREEIHTVSVNLSDTAQQTVAELRRAQPERQVEFAITPGLMATGDPRLIRVVLDNLLGNAWKFTSRRPVARIELGTIRQNGRTVFFVRDNGAGFDMAYVDKLFGPFQRLHGAEEFPGTGIGLATVQRIIHRHGGAVWAEGAVDRGATFYFTLGQH